MPEAIGLQAVFETAQFNAGLNQYMSGVSKATGATSQAASGMSSMGGVISTALGSALGFLAASAIPAVVNGFRELVSGGIEAVSTLQNLTIALESLTAREIIQAGITSDMASALQMAVPAAQSFLAQLQQIALVSPFEYEDVVNVFRLEQAFGLGTENALSLTQAILDMSAALGVGGDMVQRIAYNFGQMALSGKVTARDVRDLAMAGVNLADVFRTELGMSIDEVNEALEAGKLTMQDVVDAFTSYASTNFAGAAERMSKTLSGLKSSFADLAFFASQDLLGPVLGQIAQDLAGAFDAARAFLDSGVLKGLGQQLLDFYNSLRDLPGLAQQAFSGLSSSMGGSISGAISDAFEWGIAIAENLAAGIIEGAANFLIEAMNYISDLLAAWLSPGSPPRVAPQIDTWGTMAMEEFLNGMTQADFDILGDLQSTFEDVFSTLADAGMIGEDAIGGLMASLSTQLAGALSGDTTLSDSFFNQLTSAAGPFGDELADLARLSVDLAAATEQAAQAQIDLENAQKKAADARAAMAQGVQEYNDMLAAGASEEELQNKLDQINAQADIVTEADAEAAAAQSRLDIAEETASALEDQVKLQQELIDQLVKMMELQNQAAEGAKTGGAGAEGKAGGRGGAGAGGAGALGGLKSNIGSILANLQNQVNTATTSMGQSIYGNLAGAFTRVFGEWLSQFGPKFAELKAVFDTFVTNVQTAWANFVTMLQQDFAPLIAWWNETWPGLQSVFQMAWAGIQGAWDAFYGALQPALMELDNMIKALDISGVNLSTVLMSIGQILSGVVAVGAIGVVAAFYALAGILVSVIQGLVTATSWAQLFVTGLVNGIAQFVSGIGQTFQGVFTLIVGVIQGNLDKVKQGFSDLGNGIKDAILGAITAIGSGLAMPFAIITGLVAGFVKGIINFFKELSDQLVGHSIVPDMMDDILKAIQDGLDDTVKALQEFAETTGIEPFESFTKTMSDTVINAIDNTLNLIKQKSQLFFDAGKSLMTKVLDGMKSVPASSFSSSISAIISQIISALGSQESKLRAAGADLMNALVEGMEDSGGDASSIGRGIALTVVQGVNSYRSQMFNAGKYFIQSFGDGMDSAADYAYAIARDIAGGVVGIFNDMSASGGAASQAYSLTPSPVALAPQPITGPTVNNTMNMTINNQIYNQMDAAVFEARIRQIVRSEFGLQQ